MRRLHVRKVVHAKFTEETATPIEEVKVVYKLIRFSCDLNFLVCYPYVLALSAIVMHYRRACEH